MNGDIGITLALPVRNQQTGELAWGLRVAFLHSEGGEAIRWILPSRLAASETVYALTVHKAQGSEFEHSALLLPPQCSPLLTRELAYTAITRGKRWFTLINCGNARSLEEAAVRRVQRCGGLKL
jgi:exodeoxyribonuclease V alpha subunit